MIDKNKIAEAAIEFHKAWVELVNFHHPGSASSRMSEALEARKARNVVKEAYDEAFSQLTAICALYDQNR
jgi:hypothetical protein